MDERNLALLFILSWVVCDVPWTPIIHTGVDMPVNSSTGAWVRLIYHFTMNQASESHPYWPHKTPMTDQHECMKTATLLDIAPGGV